MTGRSPARLLAPAALVVAAIALFAVLASGGGETTTEPSSSEAAEPTPAATEADAPERGRNKSRAETYVVEAGDTPLAIAERLDIDLDELLEANPDIEANALTVGAELVVP